MIVHMEKKENNKILEKLIETRKVDPDKIIEYLKEMNQASNKEAYKLTESLSLITNKITNKLKQNNENKYKMKLKHIINKLILILVKK